MTNGAKGTLSLFDAVAMAVGGMVGGGIFAVLGQAATSAGNGSFVAFGVGGALALVTGLSYSRLTARFREAGGSFSYVEQVAGPTAAGTVSWFLLVGYLFTNALYAYACGAYTARLLGRGSDWAPVLGATIVILLAGLNVLGVRASSVVEDAIVYGKVTLLLVLSGVGLTRVRSGEALPLVEGTGLSLFGAAALVFVAYEGFQLLTYDYDEIEDPERTLPRAVLISITFVTLLYMLIAFVLTGALDDATIAERSETVLADVATPVLGRAGLAMVLVAATMSTASAINATLFATGRLARRVGDEGGLPAFLIRVTVNGVPVRLLLAQVSLAILMLFTVDLAQIVTFSSLVFLSIFTVVNSVAVRVGVYAGWRTILPLVGALGCLGAATTLAVRTGVERPGTLVVVAVVAAVIGVLRLVFVRVGSSRPRPGSGDG